jgi:carbon monoxide dehydrogenase subunit G
MELNGERTISASVPDTWAALNDPETLKACVAGCESLERVGDDAFAAVVALKIGPVSARFKGNLKLTNVQAPTSYTINFDGQGGVAGFGKGSADVSLAAIDPITTRLAYQARATVGGKMAQIGSRLIDATPRRSPTTSSPRSRRSCWRVLRRAFALLPQRSRRLRVCASLPARSAGRSPRSSCW